MLIFRDMTLTLKHKNNLIIVIVLLEDIVNFSFSVFDSDSMFIVDRDWFTEDLPAGPEIFLDCSQMELNAEF